MTKTPISEKQKLQISLGYNNNRKGKGTKFGNIGVKMNGLLEAIKNMD